MMKTSNKRSDQTSHAASAYLASKLAQGAKPGATTNHAGPSKDVRARGCDAGATSAGNFASDAVLRSLHPPQQRPSPATRHEGASSAPRSSTKPKATASVGATAALLFKNTAQQVQKAALVAAARKKQLAAQARPSRQGPAGAPPRPATVAAPKAAAAPATAPLPALGSKLAKPQPPQMLPDNPRSPECSVIARDLTAGRLTPVEAVRIAGDFHDLDTYAEVSRLAVGLLPLGALQQRSILWNVYLAYAGCDKRGKAVEVLEALFAIDKLLLGLPLTRVLAHYDLGYMERVEAPLRCDDKTSESLGELIARTKTNLLAWCDVRGLQRATTAADVDHAALLLDLHGAQSPEGSEIFEDAPEGSEPAAPDEDALGMLMRQLEVATETDAYAAQAAQNAVREKAVNEHEEEASDAAFGPAYDDADPLQMLLDGFAGH